MKQIEVVAAIISKDDKIFATQRGYGDFKDWWEFPGGKMEVGESPEEALKREIREELSTEISVDEYICTVEYDYPKFHLTMHCYFCSLMSEALHLNEHEAARWLAKDEFDSVAVMANVCAAIHEAMGFWWTGFYRVLNGELVLGPFQGPVACMHIACSSLSRSEIVVPVFSKDEVVVAVLDIDSKELSTFDETDQEYLEEICRCLSTRFPVR